MAARPLYRFLLIAGLVVLAGILGGFIGTYPLFKAIDTYGSWLYVWLGAAFVATVIVLYINDSRKEKKNKAVARVGTSMQTNHSEMETRWEDTSND
jgi:nitrate/nitrite transporter NarK